MTNFLQPIYDGLGRSVRLSVDRNFDERLMNNDNMYRWEGTMISSEVHTHTTTLVGKAMLTVMDTSKEGVCVACFERTDFLISVVSNKNHDSKIRPQGLDKGKFLIPTEPVIILNLV